jgi:hypothetical protein
MSNELKTLEELISINSIFPNEYEISLYLEKYLQEKIEAQIITF